ncbi:C40 family peptidase [Frankia sp. Cppng1_Ct_nod]|uniref:C40 family peptidase n=1 Tax=Frankia sp. Cppng1_Ct_nod TaxID=2897162 RepID=UPI001F5EF3C1|nr:C40 family peptidase [Frankia sp. Cppng1_Ct_nod]
MAVAAAVTGTVALTGLSAPAWANDQAADTTGDSSGVTAATWAGGGAQAAGVSAPEPAVASPSSSASPSSAAGSGSATATATATDPAGSSASASSLGAKIVYLASKQAGKPYMWGAQGPNAFDCSGLVQYVYKQLGRNIPRVTDAQYAAAQKVSQGAKQPGDLIFFGSPGNIYHVGIYAGNDMIWAAPHSGTVVRLQKIYSSHYLVGRIG